jgi:hypothetical protein
VLGCIVIPSCERKRAGRVIPGPPLGFDKRRAAKQGARDTLTVLRLSKITAIVVQNHTYHSALLKCSTPSRLLA